MGKTVVYLSATIGSGAHYVVILCTKNAMASQRRDILKYFPEHSDRFTFVQGTRAQRKTQWENDDKPIKITTFATFQADGGLRTPAKGQAASASIIPHRILCRLDAAVGDEFQRVLRNRTSKVFKQLGDLETESLVLSSGSAVSSCPTDIWPALHLCDPKLWSSYWNYVGTYCLVSQGPFGKSIDGPNPERVAGWRQSVGPYVFHRKKDPKDYPAKLRDFLEVELEPWQKKLHDDLRQELLAELENGDMLVAKSTLDMTFKIRTAMICPKALNPELGYGAGLEAILDDYVGSDMKHAIISTPFKAPIPHMVEFFKQHNINTWTLTGGQNIDADEMDRRIAQWTNRGGIMIQTIKFAQSYELLAAENMYMLGYEWDPEENAQAEDRTNRLSSTKPVNIWYLKHPGTYDEDQIIMLVEKAGNRWTLMDSPLQLKAMMKGEALFEMPSGFG